MNKDKNYFYILRNPTSKKNGIKYFKLKEKKLTNLEFCILKNQPSKVEENNKLRKFVANRLACNKC